MELPFFWGKWIFLANGIIIDMDKTLTIDAAGRIVIPQAVRRQFRLDRSSRLDLEVHQGAIVLRPQRYDVALAEENGLLVHEGHPAGDLVSAVDKARQERDVDVSGAEE